MMTYGAFRAAIVLSTVAVLSAQPLVAAELSVDEINQAAWSEKSPPSRASIIRAQILLDRSHISPGVIDGHEGDNLAKAVSAYETREGLQADGKLDQAVYDRLIADGAPVLIDYTITDDNLKEPIIDAIPDNIREQAELESFAYTSRAEQFAERFHMDIDLLKALNPGASFDKAGEKIVVADVGERRSDGKVVRIEADKGKKELRAYGADDKLVVFYPATIGSKDTPSPSGDMEVRAVATDPSYTYDPEKNFVEDGVEEKLTLPAGPNGPVGDVWIDLTKDTYGIHGTPEPAEVDKDYSHGCVRLTNWDAEELAHLVEAGTTVSFLD